MVEFDLYLISGGEALEAAERFYAKRAEVWKQWIAFCEKHQARTIYHDGRQIQGLMFTKDRPGDAWRPVKGQRDFYTPDRRRKDGRSIHDEMSEESMQMPGWAEFGRMVGLSCKAVPDKASRTGMSLAYPWIEKIGSQYVLHVPMPREGEAETPPPEVARLTMSEYWSLREQTQGEMLAPNPEHGAK
jgi:hypothetical protein